MSEQWAIARGDWNLSARLGRAALAGVGVSDERG